MGAAVCRLGGVSLGGVVLGWGLIATAQPRLLTPSQLEAALQVLPQWRLEETALVTTCQFAGFVETVAFVNRLVAPAEALGHHPDLEIAYGRLRIYLTTHDAGGISDADIALAQAISRLAPDACSGLD